MLLKSPQLGACSQPPSTSCPSPPLISAMQTAQQHARGSGARPALSLLTASRATPSRHAPGAVAEQEVLLDPLQRLAGIGELVAALRSLRFCSASSAFSCFFSHLATWQPRPGPPPAPLPNRAAVLHGHSFVQRGGTCQPAPPRRPPAPQGRFSAPPPRWDAARCVRLRRFARGCCLWRSNSRFALSQVSSQHDTQAQSAPSASDSSEAMFAGPRHSGVLWYTMLQKEHSSAVSVLGHCWQPLGHQPCARPLHPSPRKGSQRSRRHRLRLTSAARLKGARRNFPPRTRPRVASGRHRSILDQITKFPSTF